MSWKLVFMRYFHNCGNLHNGQYTQPAGHTRKKWDNQAKYREGAGGKRGRVFVSGMYPQSHTRQITECFSETERPMDTTTLVQAKALEEEIRRLENLLARSPETVGTGGDHIGRKEFLEDFGHFLWEETDLFDECVDRLLSAARNRWYTRLKHVKQALEDL